MIFLDSSGHLFSNTSLKELHNFAVGELNLKHHWNHLSSSKIPHFDLTTENLKKRAVGAGAKLLTSNVDVVNEFRAIRENIPLESFVEFIFKSRGLKGQVIERINLISFLLGRNVFFAGIGSRETPSDILELMKKMSLAFSELGLILRSGGAIGADTAFKIGNKDYFSEVFKAQDATIESIEVAKRFHPNPNALAEYSEMLMGRNIQIVSGKNLNKDVDFLICWTPGGKEVGGTAQAIRYAKSKNIPIFNLFFKEDVERIRNVYLTYKNLVSSACV